MQYCVPQGYAFRVCVCVQVDMAYAVALLSSPLAMGVKGQGVCGSHNAMLSALRVSGGYAVPCEWRLCCTVCATVLRKHATCILFRFVSVFACAWVHCSHIRCCCYRFCCCAGERV